MNPAARASVERAAAQLVDAMARAQASLRAMFRALDEATAAVAEPPSSAPPPAAEPAPAPALPKPAPLPSATRKWDYMGRQLSCQQLAELAGCSYSAMYMRLQKEPPETAVAMGSADRGRRWRGVVVPKAKANAKAEPQPGQTPVDKRPAIVTLNGVDPRKLAPAEPVLNPNNVQAEPAKPIPDRFAVDPEKMERTFSGMRPGQYLPSESVTAKRLGGAG